MHLDNPVTLHATSPSHHALLLRHPLDCPLPLPSSRQTKNTPPDGLAV